jgi:hypothetical protein
VVEEGEIEVRMLSTTTAVARLWLSYGRYVWLAVISIIL